MKTWLLLSALVVCQSGISSAGVPSPANSTVDACLVLCPGGDNEVHVVVRDAGSQPVASSTVQVDLCQCTDVSLCTTVPGDPYTIQNECIVSQTTDVYGMASIPIRGGGTCSGRIPIYADGVLLRTLGTVASMDQNGDLIVLADDVQDASVMGKAGDLRADVNCDAVLTDADLTLISKTHVGHTCDRSTLVRPETWGRLKLIYR